MSHFRVCFLILVTCPIINSHGQAPTVSTVNQERAEKLSQLPLDVEHFKFAFRVTDNGGAIAVTARDLTNLSDAEEHLQWRLGQLARLVVRCSFAAPEFRGVADSPQVRALCESRPEITTLRGHERPPNNGKLFLELKTHKRECIHPLQNVVRLIAAQYPDSGLEAR